MPTSGALQLVPHGVAARRALWEAVDAAHGTDPLAPVTVVVPSTTAGLSLRHALARRGSGFVNVQFVTLARVAELLGAPALAGAGRAPLTPALRAEAIRSALARTAGPLARAADHPGTVRLAASTFADLGTVIEAPAASAPGSPAGDVMRAYATFRDATAGFYDEAALARAAASALADPTARTELGAVVLFLPRSLGAADEELVAALATSGGVTAILGLTGDPAADAATLDLGTRLEAALGAAAAQPPTRPPTGDVVVLAPDGDDEVREVVRLAFARAASGTPWHRMAILYRLPDPYARTVQQALAAAGIPAAGPTPRRLAATVAGRVLLALLDLADQNLARDAVAAWLASGPIRDPDRNRRVDAYRWDLLSREAGIVAGAEQWDERLTRLERARLETVNELVLTGEDETVRLRMEADIEELAALRAFVAGLAASMTPTDPSWTGYSAWARAQLDRYLGHEASRGAWPEAELDAGRRIDGALEGIAALAALGTAPDTAAFRTAVAAELDAPAGRLGRMGDGVFVGPITSAYASDFDTVFVVGMAEGVFPPRGREDPLLRDRERQPLGLPLHADRRAEERRDYLAALAAAPERVLTFPRADPRAQRKRLPSRWLLESVAALDRPHTAEDLLDRAAAPWLRVVPSYEGGVLSPEPQASRTERDVASLRHWSAAHEPLDRHPLVAADPQLRCGVAALAARAARHATEFDGVIGARPDLLPGPDQPVSATALERWATCPFQYLMQHVLRVREVPRPEELDTISPLERGTLVHSILETFLQRARPRRTPDEPWGPDDLALLQTITNEQCDRAEAAGLTGHPRRWMLERRRLHRELRSVLVTDEHLRAEFDVLPRPDGLEHSFGFDDGGSPAVVVAAGTHRVAFRGRIDRIDSSPDGHRAVVWDYKTGRRVERIDPDDPLAEGTRLQLPVYAKAAAQLTGADHVAAHYWYTRTGHAPGFDADDVVDERFTEVVAAVLDGIAAGVFLAVPGDPRPDNAGRDSWRNCCYCPYDRICPPDRDRLHARKVADPAGRMWAALAGSEAE